MPKPVEESVLSLEGYLAVLRQLRRSSSHRFAPVSPLAVLLRQQGQGEVSAVSLALAEQAVAILSHRQRHAPGRAAWPEREFLAVVIGTPLGEIDRFLAHFDVASEIANHYVNAGLWGRFKLLLQADPLWRRLREHFQRPRSPIGERNGPR